MFLIYTINKGDFIVIEKRVDLQKVAYDFVEKYFGWMGKKNVKALKKRVDLIGKILLGITKLISWMTNKFKTPS